MTREEWFQVSAYIASGSGKSLALDAMEVYFDLLKDLPFAAMKTAAQRVLVEHPWPSFPSIAELRQAAAETIQGQIAEISPGEAWGIAYKAICRIDPESDGSMQRACKDLPPVVLAAMEAMGIVSLCYGHEPVAVLRGQFMKIYEKLAARAQRQALFPAQTKQAIERRSDQIKGIVGRIGELPAE